MEKVGEVREKHRGTVRERESSGGGGIQRHKEIKTGKEVSYSEANNIK